MASALDQFQGTQTFKDAQSFQNATMDGIAKKYGFNFSRDYAAQQADVSAQAQRNAQESARRQNESMNQLNSQRIRDDYNSAASSLDKGYFQQFLGTQQSQVNRGINGGLAADQNLRLAMSKQGELADIWRTRNQASQEESMRYSNTSQTIAEALAQIEKERLANTEKMYQDLLSRGYDVLSSDRNYGLQLNSNAWSQYMDSLNYALRQQELAKQRSGGGGGGGNPKGGTTKASNGLNVPNNMVNQINAHLQNKFYEYMEPKPFHPANDKGPRPIF